MPEYRLIAKQLARVRRAWKRTAVLSGLAIVIVEALGIPLVAFLIDVLFRPGKAGRIAILAVGCLAVLCFAAKHVVAPMLRRIPDKQLALYVEEHSAEFEGALLAATEFGPEALPDDLDYPMVQSILREAELRAKKFDVRSAVDLSRLRKYGALAALVCLLYAGIGVLFPEPVSRHARRILVPWEEEVTPGPVEATEPEVPPIEFTLSHGNTKLLRGTSFALEATLSRKPAGPVNFRLRPVGTKDGETKWQVVPMERVERLHTYKTALPDVNESTQFYVTAESYRSGRFQLDVYDPLVLEGLTVVTKFPAYLGRPDRVEKNATGDVRAPSGSTVTLEVAANRGLVGGTLLWQGGGKQHLAAHGKTATASFRVAQNTTYTYEVRDSLGQVAKSPGPSAVQALGDEPPTIELRRPTGMLSLTPLGELTFEATVSDDFGIAAADLVFRRETKPDAPQERLPLTVSNNESGRQTVRLLLQFENLELAVQSEDVLTWHLEVRDRKQQKAVTEMGILAIRHFEVWSTERWQLEETAEPEPPDLPPFLTASWGIHIRRPELPQKEFERQSEQLAEQMINPDTGKVWEFVEAEGAVTQQQADFINDHARQGHGALKAHDTAKAIEELRVAVAQLVALGLAENLAQEFSLAGGGGFGTGENAFGQARERLSSLEQSAPLGQPGAQQLLKQIDAAEEAKELADKVQELEKQEAKLVGSATRLAEDKRTQRPNVPKREEKAWAVDQRRVADSARKTVDEAKRQADQTDPTLSKAADGLLRAAQRMQEAAKDMQAGRADQATREATVAREELAAVREQLTGASQDQFAEVLNEAERRAQRLTDRQEEVRDRTEDLAKDAAGRERQYDAVAAEQAAVKTELASLERAMDTLGEVAEEGNVKRETATYVEEARQDMRRSRLEQRVTNAAVELSMRNARGAESEQNKALQAMQRVLDKVRRANDSLASDPASELRRAKAEAQRAKEQLSQLNPKAAAKLQGKAPKNKRSVQGERRAELAEDTAMTLTQMKRHLEARDLVKQQSMSRLRQHTNSQSALNDAVERDTERSFGLLKTVDAIRVELEAKYQELLKSKRLFSAQSEECPPQYRPLVNSYFEALSKAKVTP
jgi:hypothetical protein